MLDMWLSVWIIYRCMYFQSWPSALNQLAKLLVPSNFASWQGKSGNLVTGTRGNSKILGENFPPPELFVGEKSFPNLTTLRIFSRMGGVSKPPNEVKIQPPLGNLFFFWEFFPTENVGSQKSWGTFCQSCGSNHSVPVIWWRGATCFTFFFGEWNDLQNREEISRSSVLPTSEVGRNLKKKRLPVWAKWSALRKKRRRRRRHDLFEERQLVGFLFHSYNCWDFIARIT